MLDELKISIEEWDHFWREAQPLMQQHHREVRTHNVPFKLAHRSIKIGEASGGIKFWTARVNSELVGYIIWYLSEHPFSEGLIVALQGPWYVRPENRKSSTGLRLFQQSLRQLKELGASVAFPHYPPTNDRLKSYFARQGGILVESTYLLWLRPQEGTG